MLDELLAAPGVGEELVLRSRVGFCALHGGLEGMTAEIAAGAAAGAGASLYAVVQPDGFRRHVPSHRYDPSHSQQLARFLDHVEVLVSVHGFGRHGCWTSILLGGSNRALAGGLAEALRPALPGYEIVDDLAAIPVDLRGLHEANPVNRVRKGGVQVELPPRVRGMGPFWADRDAEGWAPHTEALVAALATVAAEVGAALA